MSLNIKITDGENIKKVQLNENMTVREAKEKTDEVGKRWIYRGEILLDNNTLSYYNIKDGRKIQSSERYNGGGGFGLNTIDVSKNNTKIIGFDENAPFYRIVGYGFSIQAECGNDCKAKDEIVYCYKGFFQIMIFYKILKA